MKKHILVYTFCMVCISILFASCGSPTSKGKQFAIKENKICENYREKLDELNKDFSGNLDVERHSSRQAVKDEWLSHHNEISYQLEMELREIHSEIERTVDDLDYNDRQSFLDAYRQNLDISMQSKLCQDVASVEFPAEVLNSLSRIIPPKPSESQMKDDLARKTLNDVEGGYFYEENRIIEIEEYNISDFKLMAVEKENSMEYIVEVEFILSGKVNPDRQIAVACVIRYVLPEFNDWTIDFIMTKSLAPIKCETYANCVKLHEIGGWLIQNLYVKNVCDKSLEVFVKYYYYGNWKKTIVVANPQDDTQVTGYGSVPSEYVIEYVLPL